MKQEVIPDQWEGPFSGFLLADLCLLMLSLKKTSKFIRFKFLVFLLLHHFYKYRSFQCIKSGLSRRNEWRNDGHMKISTLVAMDADSKYGFQYFFSTKEDETTGSTDHTHAVLTVFFVFFSLNFFFFYRVERKENGSAPFSLLLLLRFQEFQQEKVELGGVRAGWRSRWRGSRAHVFPFHEPMSTAGSTQPPWRSASPPPTPGPSWRGPAEGGGAQGKGRGFCSGGGAGMFDDC